MLHFQGNIFQCPDIMYHPPLSPWKILLTYVSSQPLGIKILNSYKANTAVDHEYGICLQANWVINENIDSIRKNLNTENI